MNFNDIYTVTSWFWRQVSRGIQEGQQTVKIDIVKDVYDPIVISRHINISVDRCR